jgi:hypothetical protein
MNVTGYNKDYLAGRRITAAQKIAYHNEILNGFRTGGNVIRVKPTDDVVF